MASHAETMPFLFHSKLCALLFIQNDYSKFKSVWAYYVFSVQWSMWSVYIYFQQQHEIIVGDNWPQFHFRIISNSNILFSSETVIIILNEKQGNHRQWWSVIQLDDDLQFTISNCVCWMCVLLSIEAQLQNGANLAQSLNSWLVFLVWFRQCSHYQRSCVKDEDILFFFSIVWFGFG